MSIFEAGYFRSYRNKLGFTSKEKAKDFFAAKDIIPNIDYAYIELLNRRLKELIFKINDVVCESIKNKNTTQFLKENIEDVFNRIESQRIVERLNNQGRRREQV